MSTRRAFLAGSMAATIDLTACAGSPPAPTGADARARLFTAIAAGDAVAVTALLDATPSLIAARDAHGRSTFTAALRADAPLVADLIRARGHRPDVVESAWVGDWDRFDRLVSERPAQIEARHPIGGTAMYAAARGGAGTEIWRVYARCGTPNPRRRPSELSPLRAAFEHPDLATAELTAATLLGNGADPSSQEPRGSTSLHAAARRGSAELVRMLVRKGSAVASKDDEGRTPLELARREGHDDVALLLEQHQRIARDHIALRRAYDAYGRRYRPADLGDVSVAEQSAFTGMGHFDREGIEAGLAANPRLVHATATTGEMAVEAATHVGQREIAELLLEHGAPLSMPTAVVRGDIGEMRALLDAAPDRVHERGPHDFALLWYAVIGGGSIAMAELLTERGADIEEQSHLGTTALHFAAMMGQREMVAFLLERGADIDRVARKFGAAGQTARALAIAHGHASVAALLEARGARVD